MCVPPTGPAGPRLPRARLSAAWGGRLGPTPRSPGPDKPRAGRPPTCITEKPPPFHTRHPATASPGPLCPPSSLARWELPNPLDREPPQHRGLSCRLTATPLAPRTAPAVTGPGRSLDDSISGGLALSVSGAPATLLSGATRGWQLQLEVGTPPLRRPCIINCAQPLAEETAATVPPRLLPHPRLHRRPPRTPISPSPPLFYR